ncbi:MAG: hypothetical protein R3249_10000 [Nitriliruptorales bacterium]|nr:hypothetical protein [Nitriliruptorales bacterium]
MAASNSNRLLLIGVLVFVVGVVLVLLVFWGLNNEDEPVSVVTENPTTTTQPQPRAQPTAPVQRLPFVIEVPSEMEGVAIRLDSVRGLIAVPIPGDRVNIYQLPSVEDFILEDPLDPTSQPILPASATLLLSEIEILGLDSPPGAAGDVSFVVALDPGDVERLLPLIEARQLWFTLLPQPEEDTTEAAA